MVRAENIKKASRDASGALKKPHTGGRAAHIHPHRCYQQAHARQAREWWTPSGENERHMVSSSSFDACVVVAPGDGIGPALLLTVGGEDRGIQVGRGGVWMSGGRVGLSISGRSSGHGRDTKNARRRRCWRATNHP